MVAVAVGWQVFSIHHSAFDLGLIGLCEFLPLLAARAPCRAARRPRPAAPRLRGRDRRSARSCRVAPARGHDRRAPTQLWPFLVLAAVTGGRRPRRSRRRHAHSAPSLVPFELLPSAMALRSIAFQGGNDRRPRARRPALRDPTRSSSTWSPPCSSRSASIAVLLIHEPDERALPAPAPSCSSVLAGIEFIRRTPVMLGAITLDLFAVLFGGAIALLPALREADPPHGPARPRSAA